MSIFQFVWQVIALCGLVVALVLGLFSAPWYVLSAILVAALLVTWKLMPAEDIWVSESNESFPAEPGTQVNGQSHNRPYQGTQYPPGSPPSPENSANHPSVLSYRGAQYAPSTTPSVKPASAKPEGTPELKYRGAKVQSPPFA